MSNVKFYAVSDEQALVDLRVKTWTMPGGEPHCSFEDMELLDQWSGHSQILDVRAGTTQDFFEAMAVMSALRGMGMDYFITLFIPYFPGARQDRYTTPGSPLTAKIYADVINQYEFSNVVVFDAHSDVVPAVVKRCVNLSPETAICRILNRSVYDGVIIPDAGATKRYQSLAFTKLQALKARNPETGEIDTYRLCDEPSGKRYLVIDDICDGGRTFLSLAKAVRSINPHTSLDLYTSHGIYSQGLMALQRSYSYIYTSDSFPYNDRRRALGQPDYWQENMDLKLMEDPFYKASVIEVAE